MKKLITRTLTGAIYVLLLVGCTIFSPVTAFFFFALAAAATLWEFSSIMNKRAHTNIPRPINSLAGFILVAAVWLSTIANTDATKKAFALYGLLLIYVLVSELYRKAEHPLRNWTFCFGSQVYIALPFALLPLLCNVYDTETGPFAYDCVKPMALFIFLWVNDTFAYLFGCSLGKVFTPKLFPRISPKKSWIGSIGGGLFTLGAAIACCYYWPKVMPLEIWLGFAVVVIVFGTWGDLVESHIKRQLSIKDSGHILPGHGGLLDRFDSSLLAIPATVIYFILCG